MKAVDGVLPFYAVTAIFCAASALNHSCVPTVEVVSGQRGGEMHLRSKMALHQGAELTLAYVDSTIARADVRTVLRDQYGFKCTCDLCTQEERDRRA